MAPPGSTASMFLSHTSMGGGEVYTLGSGFDGFPLTLCVGVYEGVYCGWVDGLEISVEYV